MRWRMAMPFVGRHAVLHAVTRFASRSSSARERGGTCLRTSTLTLALVQMVGAAALPFYAGRRTHHFDDDITLMPVEFPELVYQNILFAVASAMCFALLLGCLCLCVVRACIVQRRSSSSRKRLHEHVASGSEAKTNCSQADAPPTRSRALRQLDGIARVSRAMRLAEWDDVRRHHDLDHHDDDHVDSSHSSSSEDEESERVAERDSASGAPV